MELLDVYNDEGVPTGRVVQRGTPTEEFKKGEHIGIVQIYIQNFKGDFLVEKSSKTTGYRYLPVSGHILSGEAPIDAIIRETKEEIGLDLTKEEIGNVGFFVIDFPVRFIYYIKKNINLDDLYLQKEEVESVSYMSASEMMYLSANGMMHPVHRELIPKVANYALKNMKKFK